MGGVKGTKYLLKIRNHTPHTTAPRKTKNSVPPLFFEKAGDKKIIKIHQLIFIFSMIKVKFVDILLVKGLDKQVFCTRVTTFATSCWHSF